MDIKELKAHAYDVLAQIEMLQNELRATNNEISKLSQEKPEEKIEEKEATKETE